MASHIVPVASPGQCMGCGSGCEAPIATIPQKLNIPRSGAMHRYVLAGASLALIAFAVPGSANQDVLQQTAKPEQWVLQTGDYANQRYSKLDQITRDNVKNLKVAWT